MLGKRLAALVAAIGLVVVAVLVRQSLDDDGGSSPGTTDAPTGRLLLVCDPTLAEACEAAAGDDVTVQVEEAGDTIARAGDEPFAWVTYAPWPEVLEIQRAFEDRPAATGEAVAVAASPMVIAGRADRLAALAAACGGTVTWSCIGDLAGEPWTSAGGEAAWGEVTPALDDPSARAVGLLGLADLVVEERGTTDLNRTDLDADGEFIDWLGGIEGAATASPTGDTALTRVVIREVDVTPAPLALVESAVGVQSGFESAPSPTALVADVVVAPPAGTSLPGGLAERLTGELGERGWDPPRSETPGTGWPSANVMIALQTLWEELT